MIQIKWKITDSLKEVDLKEFNNEWNGIYGYFEICVNNHTICYFPNRELLIVEEGNEDILYWLYKLLEGISFLNSYNVYEIQLLSLNSVKIVLKKSKKIKFSLVNSNTDEIIWSEKISMEELYKGVRSSVSKFIEEVQSINALLLNANIVNDLVEKYSCDFDILHNGGK